MYADMSPFLVIVAVIRLIYLKNDISHRCIFHHHFPSACLCLSPVLMLLPLLHFSSRLLIRVQVRVIAIQYWSVVCVAQVQEPLLDLLLSLILSVTIVCPLWVRQRVECVWSLLGDMFIRSACRPTAIVSTYVSERWSTMAICLVLSHSPTPHFLHLCMREIVNEISPLSFDFFYYFPYSLLEGNK